MDRLSVALTDRLVLVAGLTARDTDGFIEWIHEQQRVDPATPQFVFVPPADIYDFREAPPDVRAAANLLHEWFDKQPVMEPVE